ncbi:ABC transporter permease [Streptomyces sp. NBC_00286]|uniref:ABC transporter permease n=1 Tax=Streptomyces sp. NBC_00286 TaxID=2975701 RepID=UPI002E2D9F4B|nr:ABC transporter permease [Streptomyces sp. NBC_00286]
MSTDVSEVRSAGSAVTTDSGRRWRAVIALARFEARELFLQIPVFILFLAYVVAAGWELWQGDDEAGPYPVLQDVDRSTQWSSVLLWIALVICVHRAVLRSRQQGTDRHIETLVMEPWRRTVAHALSVVPFALATALVVAVQYTWAAVRPGAVGSGSFFELVVGPLSVLFFGVVGVLLARVVPSAFAVPLLVVGAFVAAESLTSATDDAHWVQWLMPVVDNNQSIPVPSDLLGRPAEWHALYLVGLIVLAACAAVLVSGGRTRVVKAVAAGAAALTLVGVAGQSRGESPALLAERKRASVAPEEFQTCVPHGRSTYCAFLEWEGQTGDWASVVRRVQSLAGGSAAGAKLTVRQRVNLLYGITGSAAIDPSRTPGQVTVRTLWGGNYTSEFAVGVASVLVAGNEEAGSLLCDARVIPVMWLALGTMDDPIAKLRALRLDGSDMGGAVVGTPTNPLSMAAQQTEVVKELLQRPRYSVAAKVKAHWTELTSPETSVTRAAELLDVPVPKGDDGVNEKGDCETAAYR